MKRIKRSGRTKEDDDIRACTVCEDGSCKICGMQSPQRSGRWLKSTLAWDTGIHGHRNVLSSNETRQSKRYGWSQRMTRASTLYRRQMQSPFIDIVKPSSTSIIHSHLRSYYLLSPFFGAQFFNHALAPSRSPLSASKAPTHHSRSYPPPFSIGPPSSAANIPARVFLF